MVTETTTGIENLDKHLSRIERSESPLFQKCKIATVEARRYFIE
jgi:hypothetical protein